MTSGPFAADDVSAAKRPSHPEKHCPGTAHASTINKSIPALIPGLFRRQLDWVGSMKIRRVAHFPPLVRLRDLAARIVLSSIHREDAKEQMRGQVSALDDTHEDFGGTFGIAGLDHLGAHKAGDGSGAFIFRRNILNLHRRASPIGGETPGSTVR